MSVIDPSDWVPTEQEKKEMRKKKQDAIHNRVCREIGDEVIQVRDILDGKTRWKRKEVAQIITPEGKQFMCLAETINQNQNRTRLQVSDIFVTNYDLQSTERFDTEWQIPAGTIIRDLNSTSDAPSGSFSRVWTRNARGGYYLDDNASPIDVSYVVQGKHRTYMQQRSVVDYTVSPINEIVDNQRLGRQSYIID